MSVFENYLKDHDMIGSFKSPVGEDSEYSGIGDMIHVLEPKVKAAVIAKQPSNGYDICVIVQNGNKTEMYGDK